MMTTKHKALIRLSLTTIGLGTAWIGSPVRAEKLSLNDTGLTAQISKAHLTRISVKGDRILNVFGPSETYVLESDDSQGQIFIKPLYNKDIYLTLITEKGVTQDLRLTPKDKAPEPLILEAKAESQKPEHLLHDTQPIIRHEVEDLLKACAEERIPPSFREAPLTIETPQHKDSPYLLIREIQNDQFRGLTYEVKNDADIPLILAESDNLKGFAENLGLGPRDIVAVQDFSSILQPHTRGQFYVVAKRK